MKSNTILPKQYTVSGKKIDCYFNADFSLLQEKLQTDAVIFITDDNVYNVHKQKFSGSKTIVIKAGEEFKNQETVDYIIGRLLEYNADRQTFIAGVGGGVITDVAGYVASVYMRGLRFGFVPTSILAMADAAVGGKNGIDIGVYKNIVGTIRQPEFLFYDYSFLETLPRREWINGFAEIIKHACIRDKELFYFLQDSSLERFQASLQQTDALIQKNVDIKYTIVGNDEFETGERKLLNFGHTIGHAIENTAGLPHGHAVSIGMMAACRIAEAIVNFNDAETEAIKNILEQYYLPTAFAFDKQKTWNTLLHDKKKSGNNMSFVVLNNIGSAAVSSVPLDRLHKIFNSL